MAKPEAKIAWQGQCESTEVVGGKTRKYYPAVKVDGEIFVRGDVVHLKAPAGQDPYIARVERLWEEVVPTRKSKKLCVTCRWFYRRSDLTPDMVKKLRKIKAQALTPDNEIFWTKHEDENTVQSMVEASSAALSLPPSPLSLV